MDSAFDDWESSGATIMGSEEDEETRHGQWGDRPSPSEEDELPQIAAGTELGGRFRLEQRLGQPLGTLTWRAFDLKLHRPVLVHIMAAEGRHTPDVLEAARRAAIATDSRFLRVLDAVEAGPEDPGSFVVCEYAPGRSVEELLESGPLSALEAAWIVRELADAMAPLHAQGIFHERLNPDNVIVTSTGNVKIVGLLIDAALHPWSSDQSLTWSEREARDVTDMGRLLYACLVSRWPAGTLHHPQRAASGHTHWGLAPAPVDRHGWLPPRHVRSGISPALDELCDQILSEVPRHDQVPIRTANEVAQSLTRMLGNADAAADLERRLRYPAIGPADPQGPADGQDADMFAGANDVTMRQSPVSGDNPPTLLEQAVPASADDYSADPDDDGTGYNQRPPGVDEDGYWSPEAAAGEWAHVRAPDYERSQHAHRSRRIAVDPWSARQEREDRAARAHTPATPQPVPTSLTQPRPNPRRWITGLVALVVITLVICLIILGARKNTPDEPASAAGPKAAPVAISKVDDFDPEADGGNEEENPNLVALAWDGKTNTAWKTLVYRGSPNLGRLKPGVGLVVDLGQTQKVGGVTVTLDGGPTDVSIWTPASASSNQPPMNSIKSWTRAAGRNGANGATVLKPAAATSSRYVLVYLTKLPQISSGRYQGAVAEVQVK